MVAHDLHVLPPGNLSDTSVALNLKSVGGFSVREIGRAFLADVIIDLSIAMEMIGNDSGPRTANKDCQRRGTGEVTVTMLPGVAVLKPKRCG